MIVFAIVCLLRFSVYYQRAQSGSTDEDAAESAEKAKEGKQSGVLRGVDSNNIVVSGLRPNSLYVFYLTSVTSLSGDKVESDSSETLVEWTDPVVPAYAEVRNIHEFPLETL